MTSPHSRGHTLCFAKYFLTDAAQFCRMPPELGLALRTGTGQTRVLIRACVITTLATSLYGFTFGLWRSPLQGLYSAIKLPLLFFAVVAASTLANTVLAQLSGARLSLRQCATIILSGMTVTAIVLAGLAPVMLFLILQAPAPDPAVVGLARTAPAAQASLSVYRSVLLAHVAAVGLAGLIGNVRLYRLIRMLVPDRARSLRLLAIWLAITGFVGCQLSWLLSPFVCEPTSPPHVVARLYFQFNFYEYVWSAAINRF